MKVRIVERLTYAPLTKSDDPLVGSLSKHMTTKHGSDFVAGSNTRRQFGHRHRQLSKQVSTFCFTSVFSGMSHLMLDGLPLYVENRLHVCEQLGHAGLILVWLREWNAVGRSLKNRPREYITETKYSRQR